MNRSFQNTTLRQATAIARAVLVALSLLSIGTYLAVAALRLRYPFELEWMEGGMVDHVRRILAGQPIYARPSLDFVAYLYPPLYYVVSAAACWLLGVGFAPMRFVSLLSSVGAFVLIYALVRRETASKASGIIGVGLFAATYAITGRWMDLARLDSFYLMLVLAAIWCLRAARTHVGAIGAGLLIGAAYLTKQSVVVIALPMAVWSVVANPRRGASFVASAGLIIAASTIVLNRMSDGWFGYYCFVLASRHPQLQDWLLGFWTRDMIRPLGGAIAVSLPFVASRLRAPRIERFFPLVVVAGMVGGSWSVRSAFGAEANNLIPAYAGMAILAALSLHDMTDRMGRAGLAWPAMTLVAELILVAQFARLAYDPRRALPTAADRAAGTMLVSRIAAVPGEVYVPHHGYLAELAGKRSFAHTLAMDNVFLDDSGPIRRDLSHERDGALHDKRFGAVLLEVDRQYEDVIRQAYPACERLFDRPDTFIPVAGGPLRPEFLCLP